MKPIIWVVNILVGILGTQASANILTDQPVPIGHCYHWLQTAPGYLDFKYSYAKDNGNELTFYTSPATSNGSVAGAGLYCAKSPSGSYGYGNRIIRIEFVRDVVILDASTGRKYCGTDGKFYANDQECQSKDWDVKLYNRSPDWYVIQNPRAVMSWSASIPEVTQDLQAEARVADSTYSAHAQNTIQAIQQDVSQNGVRNFVNTRARMGFAEIIKSEKLLRSIPALSILSEFNRSENRKIDAGLMAKVLADTVTRVLQDGSLPWSDVKPLLKANKKVRQALIDGTLKQIAELKADTDKNFEIMLMVASQKASGITPEQIQTLITQIFKNPMNFGQTRFSKNDLSEDLKKQLLAELTRLVQAPETKNDLNMIASLVSFTSANNIDKQIKTDVTAVFYEHVKSMTASKYVLGNRKTKYPLGDTIPIAVQLCQAHIAAYNLINKDLAIISGDLRLDVGQISSLANAASFCQQQASLMDVMAQLPKEGGGKTFVIKGTIQNIPFKFIAIDQESVAPQLASFLKKNPIANVDSIVYSVNDAPVTSVTNGRAYWTTSDEVVKALTANLPTQGIYSRKEYASMAAVAKKGKGKTNKLEMIFENIPLKFNVDFIEDFDEQCMMMAPSLDGKDVDDISFTLNGTKKGRVTNGGWWRTATESCTAIRQTLKDNGLLSRLEAENLKKIAAMGKGKANQINMLFQRIPYTFGADTIEDFDEQCQLMGPILDGKNVDDISFTMSGNRTQRVTNGGWWTTAAANCAAIRPALRNQGLASREEQRNLAKIAQLAKGKSKSLVVTFQKYPVTFGVDNIEDYDEQCKLLGPTLDGRDVDNIAFSINGASGDRVTNSGWWRTAVEDCQAVREKLVEAGIGSKLHVAALAEIARLSKGKSKQIVMRFEAMEFTFGVDSLEDFDQQCALLNYGLDGKNVDDVSFVINGRQTGKASTGGWWTKASESCAAIRPILARNGVYTKAESAVVAYVARLGQGKRQQILVTFNSREFTFGVNNIEELKEQCAMLKPLLDNQSFSSIKFSINEKPDEDIRFSGYVQSTEETCATLTRGLYGKVLPKLVQQIAANKNKYRYSFIANVDGLAYTFAVNDFNELNKQCQTLINSSGVTQARIVRLETPGMPGKIADPGYGSLQSAEAICATIAANSFGFIPSEEQIAVSELKRRYTVLATFDGMPLTMKVDNAEQLIGQCLNILDDVPPIEIQSIAMKVNGEARNSIQNNSGTWTKSQACKYLSRNIHN